MSETPITTDVPKPADSPPNRAAQTGTVLKEIVAPVGVLTALAFYFGWARTDAIARELGIDQSLLGFTTADFILRSVTTVLILVAVVGFSLLFLDHLYEHAAPRLEDLARQRRENAASVGTAAQWAGLAGLAASVPAFFGFAASTSYLAPFLALIGATIYTLGRQVHFWAATDESVLLLGGPPTKRSQRRNGAFSTATTVALSLIVALSVFSAATTFARNVGTTRARQTIESLPNDPSVSVFSKMDLRLTGSPSNNIAPGAQEGSVAFPWVTDNLRLLVVGGDQLILVPADWSVGSGAVYVLPLDSSVRVEVGPKG